MRDTRENLHLNNYQTAIFFHECSSVITYLFEIQNTVDVTKRLIGLKLIYDRKDGTFFPTNAAKSNIFNAVFKNKFRDRSGRS